jgi:hypothetical protein
MENMNKILLASVAALLAALLVVGIVIAVNTSPPHQPTAEERGLQRYKEASEAADKASMAAEESRKYLEGSERLLHAQPPKTDKEIQEYFSDTKPKN